MKYIVLDMEWNQPAPGVKLEYENECCLCNEIIQIGAVALNDACEMLNTFSIDIKPRRFRHINHNVRKLTGINDKQLENAVGIETAIERFRTWCGEDFVFITWGYDDIGVLGENLKYFGLDTAWLPACYNLQMIFCAQTENLNKQYSLAYAAEYFQICLDKPLHNALTDAEITAEVCAKLDMQTGIHTYRAMVFKDKSIPEHMKNIKYKRNHRAFDDYQKLLEATHIQAPVCHECGKLLDKVKTVNNGFFHYLSVGSCPEHGDFAELLKIHKVDEHSFNATEMYFAIDSYNRHYFMEKARKMQLSEAKRKQKKFKKTAGDQEKKQIAVRSVPAKAVVRS